ncbi:ComEC/Rec2 family competence protein [Helicobacter sp. 11S03491-1]|uniref:ComEC/Rec2 family competence protein n=1 Tax=Helicobacter sp. 11S03491-1 TaxID=1476196 RepID=UPI000BA78B65|nr:ComEC/Rec2 family competence protein [Helicobacter sp. 11S03491-1]
MIGILVVVFVYSLGHKYYEFSKIDFSSPQEIHAQVLLQYEKFKKKTSKYNQNATDHYFVLKLMDLERNIFYTISKEDIKMIANRYVRVYGQIRECSFMQFLKSCYINAYSISLLHKRDFRDKIRSYIDTQHQNDGNAHNLIGNLYRALFIADPLDKSWREISNALGLAHIIAISGFHLGILSTFLYVLFRPFYRYFQRRYFSYRNEAYDLGGLVLIFMFGYLLLLDYQPSFFRSFIMAIVGFFVYFSGIRIFSFSLLFFVCLFCIAFFPALVLNAGFILSVAGVFYIFLFIKHFPKISKIPYWICFDIAIFLNITSIVHYFFPYFSPYQFISIPVSILFIIFFPLSLVSHFLRLGDFLDYFLLKALLVKPPVIEYYTSIWWVIFYVGISLYAFKSKIAYWFLNALSVGFFIFLLLKYL